MIKLGYTAIFRKDLLAELPVTVKTALQYMWEEIVRAVNLRVNFYAVTGPPSSGTAWTVMHGLGTTDIVPFVRIVSTGVGATGLTFTIVDANTLQITSGSSMTLNTLRVVIHG